MSEPQGQRKQPGPSRLRHEVPLQLTPEVDQPSLGEDVQEYDSQTIIPETQLEALGHDVHVGRIRTESPTTAAILLRNALPKDKARNSGPFNVSYLTKLAFGGDKKHSSPEYNPFRAQARAPPHDSGKGNNSGDMLTAKQAGAVGDSHRPAEHNTMSRSARGDNLKSRCDRDGAPEPEGTQERAERSPRHPSESVVLVPGKGVCEAVREISRIEKPADRTVDDEIDSEAASSAPTTMDVDMGESRKLPHSHNRRRTVRVQSGQSFGSSRPPRMGAGIEHTTHHMIGASDDAAQSMSEASPQDPIEYHQGLDGYIDLTRDTLSTVVPTGIENGLEGFHTPGQEVIWVEENYVSREDVSEVPIPQPEETQISQGSDSSLESQGFGVGHASQAGTSSPNNHPASDNATASAFDASNANRIQNPRRVRKRIVSKGKKPRAARPPQIQDRMSNPDGMDFCASTHSQFNPQYGHTPLVDTPRTDDDHTSPDNDRHHKADNLEHERLLHSSIQQNKAQAQSPAHAETEQPDREMRVRITPNDRKPDSGSVTLRSPLPAALDVSHDCHTKTTSTSTSAHKSVPMVQDTPDDTGPCEGFGENHSKGPPALEVQTVQHGDSRGENGTKEKIVAQARPSTSSSAPRKSRSGRATNSQMKPQSRTQAVPEGMANDMGPRISYADIFEQQIHSLRTTYYSEVVKSESQYGAEVKIRDERISDLQVQNQEAKDRIAVLEENEVDRRSTLKQQCKNVKDLQKYIKGLSSDHEKFRETTRAHKDECSTILAKKIGELENQKKELEQNFLHTVEALEKSRGSTSRVLHDCYTQLEVSESKRLGLVENLKTQTVLFEEERKKRTDLEQQIVASLQTVQHSLQNNHRLLLEKLEGLTLAATPTAEDEERNAYLNECISALKDLNTAPLLTIKDVQKAEKMLRFVHDSIASHFSSLNSLVKGTQFSTEDLEAIIHKQLDSLKIDVLKFEETSSELRECQQFTQALTDELQLEKAKSKELNKRIEELLQSECELKSRSDELQSKVMALENKSTAQTDHEVISLRDQLRKAEDEVQNTKSKLEENARTLQAEQESVDRWKSSVNELEAQIGRLQKEYEEKASKAIDDAKSELASQQQLAVDTREAEWKDKLASVEKLREEQETRLQGLNQQIESLEGSIQISQQKLIVAESDADREKSAMKLEIQKLLEEKSTISSQLTKFKEKLKDQEIILDTREKEASTLRGELEHLILTSSGMKSTLESLQSRLEAKEEALEQMQNNGAARLEKHEKQAQAKVEKAQGEVLLLQGHVQELQARLNKVQSDTQATLERTEARSATEHENTRKELDALRNAKRAHEQEMKRLTKEAAEKLETAGKRHTQELDELKRQLEQAFQAQKESDAKCRRIESEKNNELATHKRVTADKMREKFALEAKAYLEKVNQNKAAEIAQLHRQLQVYQIRGAAVNLGNATQPQPRVDSLQSPESPSSGSGTGNLSKPKRNVDRHSNSALELSRQNALTEHRPIKTKDWAGEQNPPDLNDPAMPRRPTQRAGMEYPCKGRDILPPASSSIILETQELIPESQPLVPETQEVIPETQEAGVTFASGIWAAKAGRVTERLQDQLNEMLFAPTSPVSSLPDTSPVKAKGLQSRSVKTAPDPAGTAKRHPLGRLEVNRAFTSEKNAGQPSCSTDTTVYSRPVSNANTASRMAPPAMKPTHAKAKDQNNAMSRLATPRPMSQYTKNPSRPSTNATALNPGKQPRGLEIAVSRNRGGIPHPDKKLHDTPAPIAPGAIHKRKEPPVEEEHGTKRRRSSPRLQQFALSRTLAHPVASSSRAVRPSQNLIQKPGSSRNATTKSKSKGKDKGKANTKDAGPRRSKSSRYDLRFAQELS